MTFVTTLIILNVIYLKMEEVLIVLHLRHLYMATLFRLA